MAARAVEFSPLRLRAFSDVTSGRYGGLEDTEEHVICSQELQVVSRHTFLEVRISESLGSASDAASCCGSAGDSESTCTPLDSESNSWADITDNEAEVVSRPPGSFAPTNLEAPKRFAGSVWGRKRNKPSHTSVVLKNLPESCTNSLVLELLAAAGLSGQFDFLYVPTDFRDYSAFGYAFVNFVSPDQAELAITRLSGLKFTDATLEATWCAEHQGYAVHVRRYRNSPVMHSSVPEMYKPMIFKNGVQQCFPDPTKKIKEPRLRRGQVERQ